MPWMYCQNCERPIDGWEEGLTGCRTCGWQYYDIEDANAFEVIIHLLEEVNELKEEVKELKYNLDIHTGDYDEDYG